jgi:hypothetical protein
MAESLVIEMNPPRVEVEPGGPSAETTVTLHNLGNVVEQYTTEIVGLDPEWYSAPQGSIGLFPQDRDQVRVSFHPPKRPGLRAGAYPFRIMVRSKGGSQVEQVDGVLDVRGYAVYRADLTPRRRIKRGPGKFTVHLMNTGTVDVRLSLEARDAEEACTFKFGKDDSPLLPAGSRLELPLTITATDRPMIGAERQYDFIVTARPQDARGEPQTVPGQFVYKPLFATWAPILRLIQLLLLAAILFVAADFLVSTGVAQQLPRRVRVASAQAYRGFCQLPFVKGFCPASAIAAQPEPAEDLCFYDFGFKDFFDAEPALVGGCETDVAYDGFGNAIQYTKNGMMFWLKNNNTVYFFTNDSLYAHIDEKTRLLDGPPPA